MNTELLAALCCLDLNLEIQIFLFVLKGHLKQHLRHFDRATEYWGHSLVLMEPMLRFLLACIVLAQAALLPRLNVFGLVFAEVRTVLSIHQYNTDKEKGGITYYNFYCKSSGYLPAT